MTRVGEYYRCPVCHYPFTEVRANHDHIREAHQEAAHLYLAVDHERKALLRVYRVSPLIYDDPLPPAA
jgi:hypothetical protein